MESELTEEWIRLETDACGILRAGFKPRRRNVRVLFQILVLPSFAPCVSWELCREGESGWSPTWFAMRGVWRRDLDSRKFDSPVERNKHPRPLTQTVERSEITLSPELAQSLLNRLSSVAVPVYVESEWVGLDGTSYEFAFGGSQVEARFAWWETPPKAWQPLAVAVQEIVDALVQLTGQSELAA